jgi:hypothetical protein
LYRYVAVYDMHYDRAVVYAKRSYAPGEEVTESYGGWSMADTLASAGYLPSHSRAAAAAAAAAGAAGKGAGKGNGEGEGGKKDYGGVVGSDCVLLNLVPPASSVNGSTADREAAAAGAGAGAGAEARAGAAYGAGAGAAGEDEPVLGLEATLQKAGFAIPWWGCTSRIQL